MMRLCAPSFRGYVDAQGVFLPSGRPELARRIMESWRAGARLIVLDRDETGVCLLYTKPERRAADVGWHTPLVRRARVFAGCPLLDQELVTLGADPDSVVLPVGGVATVFPPRQQTEIDPASMIDVSALSVVQGQHLAAEQPAPTLRTLQVQSLSEALPSAPTSEERAPHLDAFRRAAPRRSSPWRGFADFARGLTARLARKLAVSFGMRLQGAAIGIAPPGLFERLDRWLRRLVAKSPLMRALSFRQARYVSKFMDMFNERDFDEALRHAIPLSQTANPEPPRVQLGTPTARSTLELSRGGRATTMLFSGPLFAELMRVYRQAFQELDRAQRTDDAAFVLAELVGSPQEAIAYLESKGRLRDAAGVADAKDVAPAIRVRQWFLAGDKDRAVDIAIRFGAFADAVIALERSGHEAAAELRRLWAAERVAAGDDVGAIEVLWRSDRTTATLALREEARPLIDRVVAQGGLSGARMLARQLVLARDEREHAEVDERLEAMRADSSAEVNMAEARSALALALVGLPHSERTSRAARAVARQVIAESDTTGLSHQQQREIAALSGPALRADFPDAAPGRVDQPTPSRLRHTSDGRDVGTMRIYDAARTRAGDLLLALGEAGMWIVRGDGRRRHQIAAPAQRLVVADSGARFLALAPREKSWLVTRVDVGTRETKALGVHSLVSFADTYDGRLWFVADGSRVWALDTLAPERAAVWGVDVAPGLVFAVAREPTIVSLLVIGAGGQVEVWRYALPAITLRERRPAAPEHSQGGAVTPLLFPSGKVTWLATGADGKEGWLLAACARGLRSFRAHGSAIGMSGQLWDQARQRLELEIIWAKSGACAARLQDERLIVCDDRGRVVVVRCDGSGAVVERDLRI